MAATQKKQIWFWGTSAATPPPLRIHTMTAGQGVIMPGSPVEINAGYLELSDTDDTQILGFLAGNVSKTATWPLAATTTAVEMYVAIARAGDLYAAYCDSDGTDSAVAQANVGEDYGITVGAESGYVGYTTINLNETSNVLVRITDIASNVEPAMFSTSNNPGVAIVTIVGTLLG